MLQIAVINESTAITSNAVKQMIPAFSSQWNNELNDVWGVGAAQFTFVENGVTPPAGSWWVVFLDDTTQADALAYHDLTDEGLPISLVFVKTVMADKGSVSVAATHEICEMAVDPWLNTACQDEQGTFWACEVCDPVEDEQYGYEIDGILVTDFVTPDWFAPRNAMGDIDYTKNAHVPFEVLSSGYAQRFDPDQGWVQVTGSQAKKKKRAHAQRGTRRERRARQWSPWKSSGRFHTSDDGAAGGGHPKPKPAKGRFSTADDGAAGGGHPKPPGGGGGP